MCAKNTLRVRTFKRFMFLICWLVDFHRMTNLPHPGMFFTVNNRLQKYILRNLGVEANLPSH